MVTRVRISSQTFVFIAMLLRYAAFGMGCTLLQCLGNGHGNQRIRIMEKVQEFSTVLLPRDAMHPRY